MKLVFMTYKEGKVREGLEDLTFCASHILDWLESPKNAGVHLHSAQITGVCWRQMLM